MKTITSLLTAIVCASSPLFAEGANEPKTSSEQVIKNDLILGKEAIAKTREKYKKGDYNSLLKELDDSYKAISSQNQLSGLVETRTQLPIQTTWEDHFQKLQRERNRELLQIVPDKEESLYAQKVRSVAANLSTPDQEKAIEQLSHFRLLAPNTGKNSDENQLIELDLEYEYKAIHLDMLSGQKPSQERREKQVALRMEKMEKMIEAAKSFKDPALRQAVQIAAANADDRLAQGWDAIDLNALAKSKTKNPLEQKIVSVLSSYQTKFNDLSKQLLVEKHDAS